jgi:hypothetical protein
MKLTICNNGIREPEMRLVAMVPYIFIMILGNVVNAVGYQKKWPWQVSIYSLLAVPYVHVGTFTFMQLTLAR